MGARPTEQTVRSKNNAVNERSPDLEALRSKAATIRKELDLVERRIAELDPQARPQRLTNEYIRDIRRPGIHSDNRNGLRLRVVRSAKHGKISKQWVQRLQIDGRRTDRGLGGYPVVSLEEAREIAARNQVASCAGNTFDDQYARPKVPTFAEAADVVLQIESAKWKGGQNGVQARRWRASIRNYAIPTMGKIPLTKIAERHVLQVLEAIWVTKHATAKGLRGQISAILQWAVVNGHRNDNPAGPAILNALPAIESNSKARNQEALHFSKVADAIDTIRESRSCETLTLLVEFLVLTAARESEALGALWNEIDLESNTWRLLRGRRSFGTKRLIPLSNRAVEILIEAKLASERTDIVFPSRTGKAFRRGTIVKTLRDRGISATTRGFRTSFSNWAKECTKAPPEVVEACLGQFTGAAIERTSAHLDSITARRDLLQAWSDYLST